MAHTQRSVVATVCEGDCSRGVKKLDGGSALARAGAVGACPCVPTRPWRRMASFVPRTTGPVSRLHEVIVVKEAVKSTPGLFGQWG